MADRTQLRDRYELKEVLGRGGMGVVYRAWDTLMKREVALKTVLEVDNPLSLDLFFREWGVLAAMVHPNIISIYDIGEVELEGAKRPFFVMPLLPGVSLDRLIKQGSPRLTVPRLTDIIVQASRGLQAAHDMGLVHRDVKPSNIFVMDDDSVKLIDFGIARLTTSASQTSLKGTLSYIAPEQLQMKPPTPLSDQYALGVVAYEALTRRLPFQGATEAETVNAILHLSPPPICELNNSVNYAISQVVHKALAKNPWNRFPNAKEFGEWLQKAVRGEPLEYLDTAKVKPRLRRAVESFEQGDYDFASEILSEIESEGHLNQEVVLVRRQVEQAIRRKRIGALLDSARRFHQAHEYTLALRKIQEALDLDSNDPDVLALKGMVEKERRSRKIDEWIQIAREHLGNQSFQQARDALDKILKIKPDDTEALRLMADVRRGEQELARTRERKSQLYRQAMDSWQRGEVTSALSKLEVLASLEREHPDSDTGLSGSFQGFYNQVRSEHDTLKNKYSEARRLLSEDEFEAALAITKQILSKYPNHALFQALEYDIKERKSQKLSAVIAETDRRVEQEQDLDRRLAILEEVNQAYPGEKHFEQALRLVRDKRDLINSIVAKARYYEEQQQFNEALDQWQIVRSIHERFPGLEFELERLAKRRDQQAREMAKNRWVERIDRLIEAGDYSRAASEVRSALGEFPNDAELLELEKLVNKSSERSEQAQMILDSAREFIDASDPDRAIPLLREASQLDPRNSVIGAVLANALLEAARRRVDSDPEAAEQALKELFALEPNHPGGASLAAQLADRKREEFLSWCLAQARRLQTDGDIEGALAVVNQGLLMYPQEPRLHQLRTALERLRGENKQPAPPPAPTTGLLATSSSLLTNWQAPLPSSLPAPAQPPEAGGRVPPVPAEPIAPPAPAATPAEPPPAPGNPLPPVPPPKPPPKAAGVTAALKSAVEGLPRVSRNWIYAAALAFVAVWVVIALVRLFVDHPEAERPPRQVVRQVVVQALPDGAEIRIGDNVCGISRCEVSLPSGIHRAVATLMGYEPASMNIYVPDNETDPLQPFELKLTPVAPLLTISTNMEGAQVSLDGAPLTEIPGTEFVLRNLVDGDHTIRLVGGLAEATFSFQVSRTSAPVVILPLRARAISATVLAAYGGEARVYSTESAAKLALDGMDAGDLSAEGTPLTGLGPGAHEVVLTAAAGGTHRLVFEAGSSPTLVISAAANLNLGGLRILTSEDDVKVFIGGSLYRRPTVRGRLLLYLPPKEYAIRVEKDGFITPPEQTVTIVQGQEARLDFKLAPVPLTASLVVRGGIPDSEVSMDGRRLGMVQADGVFTATGIEPGKHTLQIRKERYRPLEVTHDFAPGKPIEIAGALESAVGKLVIQVMPADAAVKLELQREGDTARRPVTNRTMELPEGVYTVVASAAGFHGYEATVKIVPSQSATAMVQLQPLPTQQAKPSSGFSLADWEAAGGWAREGSALVRRGGDYVLLPPSTGPGVVQFRAELQRGKRLDFVVNFRDQRNHILYRLERRELERAQFVNGRKQDEAKRKHTLDLEQPVELVVTFSGDSVNVSAVTGNQHVLLDSFQPKDPSVGRFGFRIPGRDQIALTDFKYSAK
ncbi:MAG: protein kinase [Bryobacteraceae bacterium]|nr:protein kinase [Bryobacteraceae bacterium]